MIADKIKIRLARWADVDAVAKLIYDVCEADGDVTVALTPQELKHQWHSEGFNPETDTCVVETEDGQIIGYGEFANEREHAHLGSDVYVHPQCQREGILSALMKFVEERARVEMKLAEPDLRVFIRSTMDGKDDVAKRLHEAMGYVSVRFNWRMEIQLEAQPPAPVWPDGVELRPFEKDEHAIAVWQVQNESFRDHWGSHDIPFEEFCHQRFETPEYDPTLWAVAWEGDEIAGISINRFRMGIGWVGTLGVRRPWRKKGLGLALLNYSFGEFYKRGMKTIGLGVDPSNPTGATRLYQRAGMAVVSEFITYDKELRPGRDLAKLEN